jgi:osmoprotectant transport system ATP-binding protein
VESKQEKNGARIVLDSVTKIYPNQAGAAVENFNMEIEPGEMIMLVGPSGCGKTTTMKMINRLIEPSGGSITIDGEDVMAMDPNVLRRKIGYVIQQIGLFPHMTIADNIAVVPRLLKWDEKKINDRVEELLDLVDLDPKEYANRYPRQLSGGQQQRIGVARGLAADPPVMLMDEPFGATDPITREKLQDEFLKLQKRLGKTIVFVTHDFEEAVKMGNRIAVLGPQSKIEQFDTPAQILAKPANDYVNSFIGSGSTLKHLALISLENAKFGDVSKGVASTQPVYTDSNLRDALDAIMTVAGKPVIVLDETENPVGSVSVSEVSRMLGVEVDELAGD